MTTHLFGNFTGNTDPTCHRRHVQKGILILDGSDGSPSSLLSTQMHMLMVFAALIMTRKALLVPGGGGPFCAFAVCKCVCVVMNGVIVFACVYIYVRMSILIFIWS